MLPGGQPDGRVQLPTQWSLKPTGKHLAIGDFPVNIAVHPKLDYAAILHTGFGEHEVVTVDLKKDKIVSRVSIPQAFYGLLWDAPGEKLFASGGEHEVVHRFAFKEGYLSEHAEIRIVEAKQVFVPAGLAVESRRQCALRSRSVGRQDRGRIARATPNPSPSCSPCRRTTIPMQCCLRPTASGST